MARMTLYSDLEAFVHTHRQHGELTYETNPPSASGYKLDVACPCGVVFERWVLPQDAEDDLLRSGLSALEN